MSSLENIRQSVHPFFIPYGHFDPYNRLSLRMASHARSPSGNLLSEDYIQDCFHSYLKSSLTQAKVERLLDADILSSAEGDLMLTGKSKILYTKTFKVPALTDA